MLHLYGTLITIMNQYWYIIINRSLWFIHMSSVSPWCPRSHSGWYITFSTPVSRVFLVKIRLRKFLSLCFWCSWQFWQLLVRYFVDCPSIGIKKKLIYNAHTKKSFKNYTIQCFLMYSQCLKNPPNYPNPEHFIIL